MSYKTVIKTIDFFEKDPFKVSSLLLLFSLF